MKTNSPETQIRLWARHVVRRKGILIRMAWRITFWVYRVAEKFHYKEPHHNIGWRDKLRWWIEAKADCLFAFSYDFTEYAATDAIDEGWWDWFDGGTDDQRGEWLGESKNLRWMLGLRNWANASN